MSDDPSRYRPSDDEFDQFSPDDYEYVDPYDQEEEWYESPDVYVTGDDVDRESYTTRSLWSDSRVRLGVLAVLIIIVAVLIIRSCSGGGQTPATDLDSSPTVTATPRTAVTFTPTPLQSELATPSPATPEPTAIATQPPTGGAQVGGQVVVTNTDGQGVRFRSGPGTNYITTSILEEGSVLKVVGGPEEADGFTWWRLQAADGSIGWIVIDFLQAVSE